ncbi:MAG: ABC transporter permease, partial [Oscillospiraceae bacterium]|nr:ABC transporter permease [Oscillospiraceae bacterium]
WYDAYSTPAGKMTVTGKRETPADAEVTVIGGDFFLIHPLKLVSGVYFSEQDIMQDRVLIDTRLAWQLFGSSDASGMTVTIQGKAYFIAGVIQPEEDYASETAYGTLPRMYIPYQMYQKIAGEETGHIQCYEAVLPNPVKGFARTMLTKILNPDDYSGIFLKNTGRWKLSGRWDTLKNLKKLLICESVTYPYWENAARIISYDTAILLLFEIISLIYPVIYMIYLICKAYCSFNKYIAKKRYAWKNHYHSPMHTNS